MIAGVIPEFRFGPSFLNVWRPPYPPDGVVYYEIARQGSDRIATPSGLEDAWVLGTDCYVTAQIRWMSRTQFAADAAFSGLLRTARESTVRLYPNPAQNPDWFVAVYVVGLEDATPTPEADFTVSLPLTVRGASGARVGPVWVSIGPANAATGATFSRAGTALFVGDV